MVIVNAFFNGTPITFPYCDTIKSKEEFFKFIDDAVKDYDNDVDFYYNQIVNIEQTLFDTTKLGTTNLKKAAKQLNTTVVSMVTIWFCNIQYLLNKGKIKNDDNNGFVIIDNDNPDNILSCLKEIEKEEKQKNKSCIVCSKKSTKCCSQCGNAFYCSKDCQRLHWKKHKMDCQDKSIKDK